MDVEVGTFRHEALLYDGEDDFAARAGDFIRDGVRHGEPMLVAVSRSKIDRLRRELAGADGGVRFVDMAAVGRNPATIIPVWQEFVADNAGMGRVRGIGEPIWSGRSDAELAECEHHESLLNLALAESPQLWLMCPYDTSTLSAEALDVARRTHPHVCGEGCDPVSATYRAPEHALSPFAGELPPPAGPVEELTFTGERLSLVRSVVHQAAEEAGLDALRSGEFVMAANEVATNSVRHGGGFGTFRIWREESALLCEVEDKGHITDPLVGRVRPSPHQEEGRGLWLVNHLCDLVQIRSTKAGTTVRLHVAL